MQLQYSDVATRLHSRFKKEHVVCLQNNDTRIACVFSVRLQIQFLIILNDEHQRGAIAFLIAKISDNIYS
jgi:hypothetical protein